MQTTGKYFNGKSSQPQKVEVVFTAGFDEMKISNDEIYINWTLRDITYEKFGNSLQIKLLEKSDDFLTIEDKEFSTQFIEYLHRKNDVGLYKRLLAMNFQKHLVIAVLVLAIIAVSYFVAVPLIAEQAVYIIPENVDDKIGQIAGNQFINEDRIDVEKTKTINEFAQNINFGNHKPLNISVVKSDTVNAFALPNGQIVVYTGILKRLTDYQQLAGLLGHEVTHVNQRHTMKMLCKNLAGYIVISAIFSDVNGVVAIITENAHNLNTLSFSRKFETESDEKSVEIMLKNNIDPQGIVELLKILQKEEKDNFGAIPEILLTHPVTKNRIDNIQKMIDKNHYSKHHNQKLKQLFEKLNR